MGHVQACGSVRLMVHEPPGGLLMAAPQVLGVETQPVQLPAGSQLVLTIRMPPRGSEREPSTMAW